jgi:hypothetical protein
MHFVTVEVEIDHGRVSPKGAEALPETASGLLTILNSPPISQPRPVGLARGQFTVPHDFNAPLPDDVLQAFEGKRESCWTPASFFGSWPVTTDCPRPLPLSCSDPSSGLSLQQVPEFRQDLAALDQVRQEAAPHRRRRKHEVRPGQFKPADR